MTGTNPSRPDSTTTASKSSQEICVLHCEQPKQDDPFQQLYDELRPAFDAATRSAQEATRLWRNAALDASARLREHASDYMDKTREHARDCATQASTYVAQQPLKSVAIAAAAGAALAMLLSRRR